MQSGTGLNPYRHLEHSACANPEGIFVQSGATALSYSEANSYVKNIAFQFREAGIAPGSVVALDLPVALGLLFTEALFHEALVSCALPYRFAGASAFPVDWVISTNPEQEQDGAKFLLIDGQFLRRLEQNPVHIVPRSYSTPTTICRLVFTSGTTGKPKAVALSYDTIEFRSQMAQSVWMREQRFMSLLDASTVSGFFTFYASVAAGKPYLAPGAVLENIEALRSNSITSIKASPAQVAELVRALETSHGRLPSLTSAQIAGSVLPPGLGRRLRALTGCEIFNMYGSTEVGTVAARYTDSDDPFDAGQPTSGSVIQVVDDSDEPLPAGEVGRVRCQRPLMSVGYFNDPDSSVANFRDGWFYPGDYGILRPDGSLQLRGRESEFINAGGVKIDPVELDLFATTLPMVADASGFGYLDSAGLQQVGLAIVAASAVDGELIASELQRAFGPAAPRTIVRVEEIPRNAMGKPLRATLSARYSAP